MVKKTSPVSAPDMSRAKHLILFLVDTPAIGPTTRIIIHTKTHAPPIYTRGGSFAKKELPRIVGEVLGGVGPTTALVNGGADRLACIAKTKAKTKRVVVVEDTAIHFLALVLPRHSGAGAPAGSLPFVWTDMFELAGKPRANSWLQMYRRNHTMYPLFHIPACASRDPKPRPPPRPRPRAVAPRPAAAGRGVAATATTTAAAAASVVRGPSFPPIASTPSVHPRPRQKVPVYISLPTPAASGFRSIAPRAVASPVPSTSSTRPQSRAPSRLDDEPIYVGSEEDIQGLLQEGIPLDSDARRDFMDDIGNSIDVHQMKDMDDLEAILAKSNP